MRGKKRRERERVEKEQWRTGKKSKRKQRRKIKEAAEHEKYGWNDIIRQGKLNKFIQVKNAEKCKHTE